MRVRAGRLVRVAAVVLVAVGLVATMCVDVAVAGDRRAKESKAAAIRAERRSERLFLQHLSGIATGVFLSADPIQTALTTAGQPSLGSLVGARDAIAHGGVTDALAVALGRLRALHPPVPMKGALAKLQQDVTDMRAAVAVLAQSAGVENLLVLSKRLNGDSASAFDVAAANFAGDLTTLYDRQPVNVPSADLKAEDRTAASWIFGASSACIDAQVTLLPAFGIKKLDSRAAVERWARLWQRALSNLSVRLGRLPRPTGRQALPASLTNRLNVVGYNGRLFAGQVAAIKRSDLNAYRLGAEKIRTVLPSLEQLAKAMRSYGAVGCANVMDIWAGASSKPRNGGVRTA